MSMDRAKKATPAPKMILWRLGLISLGGCLGLACDGSVVRDVSSSSIRFS